MRGRRAQDNLRVCRGHQGRDVACRRVRPWSCCPVGSRCGPPTRPHRRIPEVFETDSWKILCGSWNLEFKLFLQIIQVRCRALGFKGFYIRV